jgi:hypothetical protein
MIISDIEKFIFIHNPKCGGTTVRGSLMGFDSRGDNYWMFEKQYGREIDKAHLPLDLLKIYFPEEFRLLSEYFVFGFVRHPIDRFVSSFNEANQWLFNGVKSKEISEDEYKIKINECAKNLTINNVSGRDFGFRHFVQQYKMYYLGNKCYADKILKIEDVNNCSLILSALKPSLIAPSKSWAVKKENVKKMGFNPKDNLSESSIENLKAIYKKDFLFFDYQC